jgi:hypothetical protein
MTPDSGTHDGGGTQDTGMPTPDSGGGDSGGGDDVPSTCGMGTSLTGTCAMPVDLATRGMMSGGATVINGNNCMAPMAPMSGIVGPSCATDTMGTMMSHGGYAVVFDYTVHATGHLVARTDMGSDPNLDTVVWIVDGCGSSAHELACNDDADPTMGALSVATTSSDVMAGTHVKIIVAGYTPVAFMDSTNMGNFTLNVSEHPSVAPGGACDATASFCSSGYTCVPASSMSTMGTCVMNGTNGAACNVTGTACTGTNMSGLMLGCTNPMPTADDPGVCLGINPNNGPCTADDPLCMTGYTCIADMTDGGTSMTMGHCKADGSLGGACRMMGTPCDMGTCDMTSGLCM